MLVQVKAPHFTAGLVIHDGIVTEAAPILRWAVGMESMVVSNYFKKKGWEADVIWK